MGKNKDKPHEFRCQNLKCQIQRKYMSGMAAYWKAQTHSDNHQHPVWLYENSQLVDKIYPRENLFNQPDF